VTDAVSNPAVSLGPLEPELLRGLPDNGEDASCAVRVREYVANRVGMTVTTGKAGMLAYVDSWDRGWRAEVNGVRVPLRKIFHTYKGVELPPGTHDVLFRYAHPVALWIHVMNGVFTVCLAGLVVFLVRRARRASRTACIIRENNP
jgi:uncharacterized membrane protein YfhO